ncbi:unnamed protein product [marine sediment metagenome]|uniref:Ribosomal subunit interface protein n=1 Tax=marine sediment metagenome TaxID=412755 RepID=X1L6M4_9ZZZZ
MKLQIITKNVEVSEAIQEQAKVKIGKLSRYLPTISKATVEISRENTKLPQQRFTVQVTLDSRGILIRTQEKAEGIRTAIDKVVETLTNQIERYKGKLYDKGRGILGMNFFPMVPPPVRKMFIKYTLKIICWQGGELP